MHHLNFQIFVGVFFCYAFLLSNETPEGENMNKKNNNKTKDQMARKILG